MVLLPEIAISLPVKLVMQKMCLPETVTVHNGAEEAAIWGKIFGSLALGVKFCCHMITEMNCFWEREPCK